MINLIRRRRAHPRGQSLVEFALVVPILILVIVGIFEGGRAIYTYNALSNATREALREAIVHQNIPAIEAEADRVLGGFAADTDMVIDGSDCGTPAETPCVYRVELTYEFEPVLIGAFFSPTLAAEGEMPVEAIQP